MPREGNIASKGAAFLSGPASSVDAIRHMCTLLRLPPLSLTVEEAASFFWTQRTSFSRDDGQGDRSRSHKGQGAIH